MDKVAEEEYKIKDRKAIKSLIKFEKRELLSIVLSINFWRMREMEELITLTVKGDGKLSFVQSQKWKSLLFISSNEH